MNARPLVRLLLTSAALFALLAAPACGKSDAAKGDHAAAATKAGDKAKASQLVEVPKAGKKFDPPVSKDKIPAGAWYCDMGTVHYARMDKGDGTCPLCHMKLKHKE